MTTGLRSSYKLSERHVSSSSAPYNSRSFVSSAPGATSSAASQSSSSSLHSSSSTSSSSSSVAALRSRLPKRSVTPTSRSHSASRDRDDEDAGRVRVAVRLRPKKSDEIIADADFADCVELHPEMKRLKLRKNNWSSESYKFDEVFTDAASQRRVYEVVAKPVVESVLNGYNGTIMAYGQTGTGKTYTVGRLGKEDASERGIMVRALEDIIAETSSSPDCTVEVSYVQLYMESVQVLLAPETTNIPISEDPKTGEVSLPGASVVKIQDVDHFSQILYVGEENRHATNTKLNTESSRSHAILMVYVRRHKCGSTQNESSSQESDSEEGKSNGSTMPTVRKSKLLIVDLAGSERIDKSGSEGHTLEEAKFINLSLTSLGKCINAVAENSPHIPTRDSKLTRLLRDSFGGSARTSLIITIGPSASSRAETTSTIMFGQRAMRIVNMLKLKEEFDYESLCRELQNKLDHLTAELERQQKLSDNSKEELEKLKERETSFVETETKLVIRSELLEKEKAHLESEMKILLDEMSHQKELNVMMCDKVTQLEISLTQSMQHQHENSSYQKVLADTTQMYEKKISELLKQIEDERSFSESVEEQVHVMKQLLSDHQKSIQQYQTDITTYRKELAVTTKSYEKKIAVLMEQLDNEHARFEGAEEQLTLAQNLLKDYENSMQDQQEFSEARAKLQDNQQLQENSFSELQSLRSGYKDLLSEKEHLDEELHATKQKLASEEKQRKAIETELIKLKKSILDNGTKIEDKRSYMTEDVAKATLKQLSSYKSSHSRETLTGQKATIAKICEEVGLQKILAFLSSEDLDVQTHAVKVVANLAAEDINQEKIVEEGGLDALLNLLQSSQNTTILRVASGAIANLAMSELNQGLVMSKGGGRLLADTSSKTNDPQTLRMVAGAIANLCGNESLHPMLQEEGGIKALLKMAASGNTDVIAQVARGLANFAKCESRGTIQGHRAGPSLLMEDGVISWLIANSNTTSSSTRRHIELALCHLAQNEDNARDFQFSGGMKELERISKESTRDDIRSLAKKTLKLNSFQGRSNSAWA